MGPVLGRIAAAGAAAALLCICLDARLCFASADDSDAREVDAQEDAAAEDSGSLVRQAFTRRLREGGADELVVSTPDEKAEKKKATKDGEDAAPAEEESAAAKKPEPKPWWKDLGWEGEFQYRYGELHKGLLPEGEKADSADRDISLHLGVNAEPEKDWKLHFAINSGRNHRPLSAYVPAQDIDKERWLFFNEYWSQNDWRLGSNGQLEFQIGRSPYPFMLSQMLYDNDLQLPSAYLQYRHQRPEPPKPEPAEDGEEPLPSCPQLGLSEWSVSLYGAELCSSALLADAVATVSDGATRLGSLRLDTRWQLNSDARLDAALSYHDFGNTDTLGYRVAAGDWRVGGNAGKGENTNYTAVTGALGSDFNLLDLHLSSQWGRDKHWPLTLEAEAVKNLGAADLGSGEDSGWYAGFTIGRRDKPNAVQIGLSRAHIEADAVLAAVNRGEYGTNTENTRLQLRFTPDWPKDWKGQADLRAAMTWANDLNATGPTGTFDKRLAQLYLTYSW